MTSNNLYNHDILTADCESLSLGPVDNHVSASGPQIAIRAKNLTKSYQLYNNQFDRLKDVFNPFNRNYHHNFSALSDVSFEVVKGEAVGIIGKNGSGKSTLLKIISGILSPTSGCVEINGNISALLELGAGFNPELTGVDNIYFNGMLMGYTRSEIESKIDDILSFADIGEFAHQAVKSYSSGMFVRLAFSVATNINPEILIIDEALSVGDIFFQQKCYKRIDKLKQSGVTILLVTHSMTDVIQFTDRALLLRNGALEYYGASMEAVKKYYFKEQIDKKSQTSDTLGNNELLVNQKGVISNGAARFIGSKLYNIDNQACKIFKQGDILVIKYEFECLENIDVPLGGVLITNNKGVIVHGKGTLEYGSDVPLSVYKGQIITFKQQIQLDIAIGEYTYEVALSDTTYDNFQLRSNITFEELRSRFTRICHVPFAGKFTVVYKDIWEPTQVIHHGICNLMGSCVITVSNNK